MPKVIHLESPNEEMKKDENVYVGFFSLYSPDYARVSSYRNHALFMKDFEPEWIDYLKGKNLICDLECEKDCHAEILLDIANPATQLEMF